MAILAYQLFFILFFYILTNNTVFQAGTTSVCTFVCLYVFVCPLFQQDSLYFMFPMYSFKLEMSFHLCNILGKYLSVHTAAFHLIVFFVYVRNLWKCLSRSHPFIYYITMIINWLSSPPQAKSLQYLHSAHLLQPCSDFNISHWPSLILGPNNILTGFLLQFFCF